MASASKERGEHEHRSDRSSAARHLAWAYSSSEESTMDDLVAKASTSISAPVSKVWDALVNPAIIRQYMFGTNVTSEWKEGSPISWKGEWKGQAYEDKGAILKLRPEKLLQYSHYSPLMG